MLDIEKTNLWNKLENNDTLKNSILDIRENCIALGETIKTLIPGFTDHSIRHMDALWKIADIVFTPEEIEKFSIAESYVLCASFYFHDLAMSIAATKEGVEQLRKSEKYKSYYARSSEYFNLPPEESDIISLQLTARTLHAENASKFSSELIPGLNKYIIEKESLRKTWSNYIGEVSESHHWSISTLNQRLGVRGVIPSPEGGNMDLAFVACSLRVIDYAHINSERANYIERILRTNIDNNSLIHWKAQENINGPTRQDNKLKFASNKPIEDVESWWLFYDMALDLDREIVSVAEFLDSRIESQYRFSLEGVKSVKNPKSFAQTVRTNNFEPIDIRFKPDSIERLIEILGGKTLYGNDQFAPLRELLQNARDAILLRQEEENKGEDEYQGKLIVSIDSSSSPIKLIIKDNGIGMTANVIENYLLGIASDYWNSQDFYNDFPEAKSKGFLPTGKFGIGFLSVFMLGDYVEIETERKGKPNLTLSLKGLGKHGSLVSSVSKGNFGTTIKIELTKQDPSIYNGIELIVKDRAPMLTVPIVVNSVTQKSVIEPYWWKSTSQIDLFNFINKWSSASDEDDLFIDRLLLGLVYSRRRPKEIDFSSVNRFKKWPDKQPEIIGAKYRFLAIPGFNTVLLCSKGIAVKRIHLKGLTGIVEVDDLMLTASRNETIKWNEEEFVKQIFADINPIIIDSLNKLEKEGMIIPRFEFINNVAKTYGSDVLIDSSIPWISIITPPGYVKLINAKEATQLFLNSTDILLSCGSGPWSTEEILRNNFPSAPTSATILPINQFSDTSFGYYSNSDELIKETLPNQFKDKDGEVDLNKYKKALFLNCILKIISKSWGVDESKLVQSEWLRKGSAYICTYLKKNDFI